jgi:predicted nucleotidyltransferase
MAISRSLAEKREEILKVAASHGARTLKVFGSFARGEERPDSDIDFLVEMAPDRSLLDIIAIKYALEDITNRKVDVVTEKALSPYLRNKILQDAVYL